MRSDLSADFQTQMALNGRSPRQLAQFHFIEAGTVYLSDQALGAADGLDNEYSALIEDWGEMTDTAGGDVQAAATSEIRQMSITIWNGGDTPFSNYFLEEDPEDVRVDIYQWFDGLTDNDKVIIDTFVIQDPIQFDESSRLLTLDLVSLSMKYDRPIGDTLKISDYPNAATDDIGKDISLVLGTVSKVPAICSVKAATATLNGSILADTTTINANEDLGSFSSSGTIQMGEEKIRYSSRTSSAFTVEQRGWTTTATEHLDRAEIVELIDQEYIVGKGPVSGITGIQVGGFDAPASIYSVDTASDPIAFPTVTKAEAIGFTTGSRSWRPCFRFLIYVGMS